MLAGKTSLSSSPALTRAGRCDRSEIRRGRSSAADLPDLCTPETGEVATAPSMGGLLKASHRWKASVLVWLGQIHATVDPPGSSPPQASTWLFSRLFQHICASEARTDTCRHFPCNDDLRDVFPPIFQKKKKKSLTSFFFSPENILFRLSEASSRGDDFHGTLGLRDKRSRDTFLA